MQKKLYRVSPPESIFVSAVSKPEMDEEQLREFTMQIIQDPSQADTWREKILKDPVENVLEWLKASGFIVEIV